MRKTILKPLLAIVCLLSSITLYAHNFEVDGIYYRLLSEENQVAVTYYGDDEYNVPEEYKYTGSVTIPETVTYQGATYSVIEIGDNAFMHCENLTKVIIPNSVTMIGEYAFRGCGLTEITIPNSVTSIDNGTFYNCIGLLQITIPNSVTMIGEYAFRGCGLTEITIPNSVTSIDNGTFSNCIGLLQITIPNSVTMIGEYAFADCTGLGSVTIGNSVTSIGYGAFAYCSGLLQITIPNSVTMIGEYAFEDCNNLTIVTIPNSVLSIGNYAFDSCEKLAVMKVKAKNPPAIKEHTFEGVDKTMHLYVPAGMIGKYQSISYWSDFINILEEEPMDVQLTLQNSIYNNVVFYLPYGTMQKLEIKTLDDSYVLNSVVFNGKDVTDEIINDVYVTPELTDDAVLNISYDTSSVENVFLNNNRIKAYGHNGNIVVTGCEYGESIAIYDVDGILLRSLLANSDMMRISMPSESIYMVKVADSAIKVAL